MFEKKIIKEHLSDPAFYEKMSMLLDEIIAARKAQALEYENYLKRIAELAKQVETGEDGTHEKLSKSAGIRALYRNLNPAVMGKVAEPRVGDNAALELAIKIDEAIKARRPDGWRGVQPREQVIKNELFDLLGDDSEVERIFLIIKEQKEY